VLIAIAMGVYNSNELFSEQDATQAQDTGDMLVLQTEQFYMFQVSTGIMLLVLVYLEMEMVILNNSGVEQELSLSGSLR
jgi:hypothetical protein